MTSYIPEFLTIATMHALAVISPGPDFAMVLRQSLRHGRATAIWTSVGIGCGLLIHITYNLLGLGLFLKNSATALTLAKWLVDEKSPTTARTQRCCNDSSLPRPTSVFVKRSHSAR